MVRPARGGGRLVLGSASIAVRPAGPTPCRHATTLSIRSRRKVSSVSYLQAVACLEEGNEVLLHCDHVRMLGVGFMIEAQQVAESVHQEKREPSLHVHHIN